MRKALLFAPMMTLLLALLCACGGKEEAQSRQVQEDFRNLRAQAEVTLTCHYADEVRTYGLSCAYAPEKSTVTVTAPSDLSGVSAEFDGETLSLRYDDLLIDAGVCSGTELSPFWAVPSLLRAMGEGYLLEVCREDLRDTPCLRAGEITVEETLVYGVDFTSFTKEGEYDGGTDAASDVGRD